VVSKSLQCENTERHSISIIPARITGPKQTPAASF
jgi:hypothetical protein